jgi:hypothetical protein
VIRGAHLSSNGELTFEIDGNTHTLRLEYIARGSYNSVYGVRGTTIPLVLRVSIPPAVKTDEAVKTVKTEETDETDETDEDEVTDGADESKKRKRCDETEESKKKRREERREEKKRQAIQDQRTELQFMRRMGKNGIGPRVYATVQFTDSHRTGVFTDKLDMSLQDAESCPYRTRRAFVDADAESALVDLYARSSRMFECIDTKSPNVLFTPGRPGVDARIAMIDMDPGFCRDAAQSSTWKKRPTPTITTLDDLEAHLSRRSYSGDSSDSRDSKALDSACISLLIHCIFSMERSQQGKGNDTARWYGFPYPRVAAHMYNNWSYVWSLVLKHRAILSSGFNAAYMVAHYHYKNGDMDLKLNDRSRWIRSAIAEAIRAPMTRILLMTKGFDAREDHESDRILIDPIDSGKVVRGDMYVRLARVHDASLRVDEEMIDAIVADDSEKALETLVLKRERGIKRFRCIASKEKGEAACCHDRGAPFCDTASSVRVRYSDAVYREPKDPKWRDLVYIPTKRVDELNMEQTARFLCHQMSIIGEISSARRYRVARNIFKTAQWTGADLARMVERKTMATQLRSFGIPREVAMSLAERTGKYITRATQVHRIGPCAD